MPIPAHHQTALNNVSATLQMNLVFKTYPESDGDIGCVFRNEDEWVRFRLIPNATAPRGFTWYVWGPKPETLDLEAQTATVLVNTMGFPSIDEDAHVLRIAQKYFFKCGYESDE
jgi:hypothetical protein